MQRQYNIRIATNLMKISLLNIVTINTVASISPHYNVLARWIPHAIAHASAIILIISPTKKPINLPKKVTIHFAILLSSIS